MENVRDYAAVPHEYLEEMDALNDAEFGRLVRSLLAYSKDGTPIALCGNERFYAKRVAAREDRFQKSFLDAQDKRSAAGQAGANARWGNAKDANAYDRMPMNPNASEEMRNNADDGNTKPKPKPDTKPNPKENTTPRSARGSARAQSYEQAVEEVLGDGHQDLKVTVLRWLTYKRERKQTYEPTGLKTLLNRISRYANDYGDQAVIGLIETSIGNNWQGIFFDRLEKEKPKMVGSGLGDKPVDYDQLKKFAQEMGAQV